ncbi:EGF-like domain-containing protein 2 [Haliotis cracherodii]|uniref:EGF-like domain-containing protein 2 n=1 Tax=Haliotis cracherodii TaxID=6455 RepID=UPI0039E7581A
MDTLRHLGIILMVIQCQATFDCRRPSQDCKNGGTCSYVASACTCPGGASPTHEGEDCGLLIIDKGASSCITTDPCKAGQGACYDDGSGGMCYCFSDYYGSTCDEQRFTVSCLADRMVIGLNPYGTFSGVAYIEGKRGTAACESSPVPSASSSDNVPDTWEGRYIEVEHTSPDCGTITATPNGVNIEYTRDVVIQYSQDYIINIDDRYTVKCVLDGSGVPVSYNIVPVNTADLSPLNTITRQDFLGPVFLALTSGGQAVSTNPIDVGAELVFTFAISPDYESMLIISGEANNTMTVGTKTLNLITGSCMDDDAFPVIVEEASRGSGGTDKREINLKLRAFHFDGNTDVGFKFLVKVCLTANAADCDPANCPPGSANGFGRRRRAAPSETIVERIISIQDPRSITKLDEKDVVYSECQMSGKISAAMIAMAVALSILILLCIALIARAVTSRIHRNVHIDDNHTMSSVVKRF